MNYIEYLLAGFGDALRKELPGKKIRVFRARYESFTDKDGNEQWHITRDDTIGDIACVMVEDKHQWRYRESDPEIIEHAACTHMVSIDTLEEVTAKKVAAFIAPALEEKLKELIGCVK